MAISADGLNVLVLGHGLTEDDMDSRQDLYNWNVETQDFQLIGKEPAGALVGAFGLATYSPDGRYVAFATTSQLSADDTNFVIDEDGNPQSLPDVYLYEFATGTVTLVTPSQPGASEPSALSLKFSPDSSTLVIETDIQAAPADDAGTYDVYRYDISSEQLSLTAHGDGGFVLLGGALNGGPKKNISADGQWIALESNEQLTSEDANASFRDVYLHDGATGTNTLVSKPVSGGLEGESSFLDMSDDASKVLIWSAAQLSSEDIDGGIGDVYLWDRTTDTITLITDTGPDDTDGAALAIGFISSDGSRLVFNTAASLAVEDEDSVEDVYLYDVGTGAIRLLSATIPGGEEGSASGQLSDDGTAVLINGWAQLTADDTDVFRDAYLLDLATGQLLLASADVPNGNTEDYAGRSPDLDTRVLWLSATFGATFYRWDAESQSTIAVPRESNVPVGFQFSADGSAVAFTEYPSFASLWFGLTPASNDDVLEGTAGADTLEGGPGDDTYIVNDRGDQVVENPDEGVDTVLTILSKYALPPNVENLTFNGTGKFSGTGNELGNMLMGGDGKDTLLGLEGNDTLYGAGGADTLRGGPGDDTYKIDDPDAKVKEKPNEGIDTVLTTLTSYALPNHVENLSYTGIDFLSPGSQSFIGVGNKSDNMITGGSVNDDLSGFAGNDTLNGGAGADIMAGGSGGDLFFFRAGEADGDTVLDYAPGEDSLEIAGFGAGSSAMQINATDWEITSGIDGHTEIIHFTNRPALEITDFLFV